MKASDATAVPVGDIVCQRLQKSAGAIAQPVVDRPFDRGAASGAVERVDQAGADQRADIGHGPVVGLVDAGIGPQPVGAAAGCRRFGGDDLDQGAQLAGIGGDPVLVAIDFRNERPELFGVVTLIAVIGAGGGGLAFETH